MTSRKPVLADHTRHKSKLVTPFNEQLGPFGEVSWINTMIPELLWIALIQEQFGPHRCVEILTAFTRGVRASHPDRADTVWAAAGKFGGIPTEDLRSVLRDGDQILGQDLQVALRPLAALYPEHPLNRIFHPAEVTSDPADIKHVKKVVADLFDRSSQVATMTQAHAVWLAFDAGRLKVASTVSLAQFPKIDEYPNTEISRRVAGAIRASLNQFFAPDGLMSSGSHWPIGFWNHGLTLEPCRVSHGGE